ncbi:peroxidase 11 [Curcuma longa]|uniref:peroxidase 11 n=1 Tax=Curcuma longa TaxID=136217 RepID=UPI003D9E81D5
MACFALLALALIAGTFLPSRAQDPSRLSLSYYSKTCPTVQDIVRLETDCAVKANPRNAAFIIRLHFHDCFVQGCDGSVLLDDTASLIGEKHADQNVNSLQGFELVDKLKEKVEAECPGVVSCADLLALAARDATLLVGGPYWDVPVGRLDSKTASVDLANSDIPSPRQNLAALVAKFLEKGLSVTDMVALVGSHTVGMSRCVNFRDRIYGGDFHLTSKGEPAAQAHLAKLKEVCPAEGGDDNVAGMDYYSPSVFDNAFFETLLQGSGVLNSDQEMYSSLLSFQTSHIVDKYWADPAAFFKDFADGMVKMGNITNPEGGEVRKNCRFINI